MKSILSVLHEKCRWVVGDGTQINFWKDNWLSQPIVRLIGLPDDDSLSLGSTVSNYLMNGKWTLPDPFCQVFPSVTNMIRNVELCDHATSDILVWEGSDKGLLTLGNAYEEFRHKFPVLDWCKNILHSFVPFLPNFRFCSGSFSMARLPLRISFK